MLTSSYRRPGVQSTRLHDADRLGLLCPVARSTLVDELEALLNGLRFDHRKLIDNLQAPLPGDWKGPPC
jgi:hypothetical protein